VVSPDSSVNLDQAFFLLTDLHGFLSSHGVFQPLLQQNVQWNALSQFMWTWRGSCAVHTFQLAKIPVLWRSKPFHTLSLTFITLENEEKFRLGSIAPRIRIKVAPVAEVKKRTS
jgi:hypothetical protein